MSSASSSTSSCKKNTKRFKVDIEGNVYRNHDLIAFQRVAGRRSVRMGQEFYGCTLWPVRAYSSFESLKGNRV
ncbi:hypothetical protein QVD17_12386 [Tagetes erecta]|uniref:Uncharacterized protein n=1 Tax=Tagetes erecta TaxID=13708 RepID=A0AAD8KUU2_TARER|nr:hypothetical protein QVD17_12386 [Tagetes erecta]